MLVKDLLEGLKEMIESGAIDENTKVMILDDKQRIFDGKAMGHGGFSSDTEVFAVISISDSNFTLTNVTEDFTQSRAVD